MKWPFSRNKNVDGVPLEIQEYYQSERRERTGIAWLLALGTLLTTIALAIILFFGGRWIYRKVADRDNKSGSTSQVEQKPTETAQTTPGQSSNPSSSGSTGTSSTATSTPSSTPSAAPNTSATSQTRGSSTTLPNTGPSDLVAIFALTVVTASLGHYAITSKRS